MMGEEYYEIKQYDKVLELLKPLCESGKFDGWNTLLNAIYYLLLKDLAQLNDGDV